MSNENRTANIPKNCILADEDDCFMSLRALMDDLLKGKRANVVFYDRASTDAQLENLESRWEIIEEKLKKDYGNRIIIKAKFSEVANGRSNMLKKRPVLWEAVEICSENRWHLLSPSIDRILRPEAYTIKNQFCPLLELDLVRLKKRIPGMMISTVIPPSAPLKWVRGRFSALGQAGWGNNGGNQPVRLPGYKKRLKDEFKPIAQEHYEKVLSYDKVCEYINDLVPKGDSVSRSCIVKWVNNDCVESKSSDN